MLIVRPARLVVHWVASGHTWQARPKRASPPPPERGVIATVRLAGQVTRLPAKAVGEAGSGGAAASGAAGLWGRGGGRPAGGAPPRAAPPPLAGPTSAAVMIS